MKSFHCDHCGIEVFFVNHHCEKCNHPLGFIPSELEMHSFVPASDGNSYYTLRKSKEEAGFRFCKNRKEYDVCNWMVSLSDPEELCEACRLNDVIPNLTETGNKQRWYKLEVAKRRCLYTLMRLGLPVKDRSDQPPLRFSFLADPIGGTPVLTGHAEGKITINIAEADDDERERRRMNLREGYRTLIGHFRHEVGHYYWDLLIKNSSSLNEFHQLFGNDTLDYAAALQHYYQQGAPADWPAHNITPYASAHPWEDWAETWAHYLHLAETIETAAEYQMGLTMAGVSVNLSIQTLAELKGNFDKLLANWIPLTTALNSLNRGMGLPDLYPFVLSPAVIEKLRFIHQVVAKAANPITKNKPNN